MTLRKAVYAASLDPITNGHINVIERMAPLYDEFIVVVAVDSRKNYSFTSSERVVMTQEAVAHLLNVSVDICVGRYVVKYAEEKGARTIVRGLRNFKDMEDEQTLAEENRRICPSVETIWVPCLPSLMHVSSSMVKGHIGVDPEWEEQVSRSVPSIVMVKMKEKFILRKARGYWDALMSDIDNPKGSDRFFDELLKRLSEPWRAYHTIQHVVAMLDDLTWIIANNGCESDISDIALAIWLHDAIYDPKAKDNEGKSADLAKIIVGGLGRSKKSIGNVVEMVLATGHVLSQHNVLTYMITDIDLSIFGASAKRFDEYEAGIRKEYDWVSDVDFRRERSKIIKSFLDRDSIYWTKMFRERYEIPARRNLERSLKRLES